MPETVTTQPDIAPLGVDDFDACNIYLRGVVRKRLKEAKRSFDAVQTAAIFEKKRELILRMFAEKHTETPPNENHLRDLFSNGQMLMPHPFLAELAEAILEDDGSITDSDLNETGVDNALQRFALDDPETPEVVGRLAHERPSVFVMMASWKKYNHDIMSMMRQCVRSIEKNEHQPAYAAKAVATIMALRQSRKNSPGQ